jgi:hypothetical protein
VNAPAPRSGPPAPRVVELVGDELLAVSGSVHDWCGDWRLDGVGAGHVRVGAFWRSAPGADRPPSLCAVWLLDLDRTVVTDAERVVDAGVVLGAGGFGGAVVTVPAAIVVQHAHTTWRRGDARRHPERRFVVAAADLADVVAFADGHDVAFYGFLDTDGVRRFVNRDGVVGANFVLPLAALRRWGRVD